MMLKTQIRRTIDIDTRRAITQAARRRRAQDIVRLSQVDFVAQEVMRRYRLTRQQIQGTPLGQEIDRLGEELRQEMLAQSRRVIQLREQTLG
jgi:hypothetical protein